MELHLSDATLQAKVQQWAAETGRSTDELVETAIADYFAEVDQVRAMLDRRYDDLRSGRIEPVDGEAFFEHLRQREDELLHKRTR